MKPCPNCNRVGTVHYISGAGCYGCNPPSPADYELVIFEYRGHKFHVEKRDVPVLEHFVNTYMGYYDKGCITCHVDSGMCEKSALVPITKTVYEWFAMRATVIPVGHPKTDELLKRHRQRVQDILQRAEEDAKR